VVETGTAISAAGPWSRTCGEMVGVRLDVTPLRRQVLFTAPMADLPARLPLTIDFATGLYLHRERPGSPRVLVGGPWDSVEDLAPPVMHRLPGLADVPIRRGWSGLYEMSPDHNAIVGAAGEPDGFLYATGFSGHGFQQAPVVGEYLADLALGRRPALDLSPFSATRFSPSGSTARPPRPEAHVV
jgi:sarcosine oxidase subunit beta